MYCYVLQKNELTVSTVMMLVRKGKYVCSLKVVAGESKL